MPDYHLQIIIWDTSQRGFKLRFSNETRPFCPALLVASGFRSNSPMSLSFFSRDFKSLGDSPVRLDKKLHNKQTSWHRPSVLPVFDHLSYTLALMFFPSDNSSPSCNHFLLLSAGKEILQPLEVNLITAQDDQCSVLQQEQVSYSQPVHSHTQKLQKEKHKTVMSSPKTGSHSMRHKFMGKFNTGNNIYLSNLKIFLFRRFTWNISF